MPDGAPTIPLGESVSIRPGSKSPLSLSLKNPQSSAELKEAHDFYRHIDTARAISQAMRIYAQEQGLDRPQSQLGALGTKTDFFMSKHGMRPPFRKKDIRLQDLTSELWSVIGPTYLKGTRLGQTWIGQATGHLPPEMGGDYAVIQEKLGDTDAFIEQLDADAQAQTHIPHPKVTMPLPVLRKRFRLGEPATSTLPMGWTLDPSGKLKPPPAATKPQPPMKVPLMKRLGPSALGPSRGSTLEIPPAEYTKWRKGREGVSG